MPLYDAKCPFCDAVKEIFRSYADRDVPERCDGCGADMRRVFLPPRVMRDIEGYVSTVDGRFISSRSEHREHLKRHGLVELGNEKPMQRPLQASIPRESIRREIKNNLERMKSHGTWREV